VSNRYQPEFDFAAYAAFRFIKLDALKLPFES